LLAPCQDLKTPGSQKKCSNYKDMGLLGWFIRMVRKESLIEPKYPLRTLSKARICQIADAVQVAMGCAAK
jgi:hypothetical protein